MLYRYQMSYALGDCLEFERIDNWPYSFGSIISHKGEEIKTSSPWPKCRLYQSPLLPMDFFSNLCFPKGKENQELPDILGQPIPIVSEKVKKIIQEVDDFPHQFEEVKFYDCKGNIIEREQYWYLNIRRRLDIESIGIKPNLDFNGPEVLGTIQNVSELREKIEQVPIWQEYHIPDFYFNEKLMSHLKVANLKHFKEYTVFYGQEDESLGHVW